MPGEFIWSRDFDRIQRNQLRESGMNRLERRDDWLKWFKLGVAQARDVRLAGDMPRARHLDDNIERYYAEAGEYGFTEDDLFPIESEIRNRS